MNVLEAIRRKRAVRKYNDRPLPEEAVEQILYAGRRAQSSKNSQPWQFIVVRNRETLEALAEMGDYTNHMRQAAMAVLILTPDPVAHYWVMFDAGQSAAYMQLAGVELGVGSCVTTLHRPEPSRQLLGYPDDLHLRMLVTFGYPEDPTVMEAPLRTGGRRPLEEIAHFEHWNGAPNSSK